MNTTIIIGDRGLPLHPMTIAAVSLEMLRVVSAGDDIATFEDEGGVAAIVRYVAAETGTPVKPVPLRRDADGKRDYAKLVRGLERGDAHVVFVGDPTICTLWTALATLPDDRVSLAIAT